MSALVASLGLLLLKVSPVLAEDPQIGAYTTGQQADNIIIKVSPPAVGIQKVEDLISAGITAMIVIAGLLTFVFLIWGGLQWLTSGGDKSKYEAARDRITAALIGLAIVAAAYAVMKIVGAFFGVEILKIDIPSAAGD